MSICWGAAVTMEIRRLLTDLEELATAFRAAVFGPGDAEDALARVTEDVTLENLPAGTGAVGVDDLRRHLLEDVRGNVPADLSFRRLSRTVDQRGLVDESMVAFTHDRPLPWLLPGVEPTGRRAEVLAVSLVAVRHRSRLGRTTALIARHRTLWDHTAVLAQLGLSPTGGVGGGPSRMALPGHQVPPRISTRYPPAPTGVQAGPD
jgi:carboxymethylenebutenolidase